MQNILITDSHEITPGFNQLYSCGFLAKICGVGKLKNFDDIKTKLYNTQMLIFNPNFSYHDNDLSFKLLYGLNNFLNEDYNMAEKNYQTETLKSMVTTASSKLRSKIYHANEPLTFTVIKDLKLNFNVLEDSGIYYEQILDISQERLVRSINRYDITRGVKASTYIYDQVNWAIREYISDKKREFVPVCSIDDKINDFSDLSLGTILIDDSLYSNGWKLINDSDYNSKVHNLILSLGNDKEIDVLLKRFGFYDNDSMTCESISKVYGVTRERIRQIESKALKKLRKNPLSKELFDTLN